MEAEFPDNPDILPVVSWNVYDQSSGILRDSMLGTFQIDITKYSVLSKINLLSKLQSLKRFLKKKDPQSIKIIAITRLSKKIKDGIDQRADVIDIDLKNVQEIHKKTEREAIQNEVLKKLETNIEHSLISREKTKTNCLQVHLSTIKKNIEENEDTPLLIQQSDNKEKKDIQKSKKLLESKINAQEGGGGVVVPFGKKKVEDVTEKKKAPNVIMAKYAALPDGTSDYDNEIKPTFMEGHTYLELGYDSKKSKLANKHYRLVLDKELEQTDFVSVSGFSKTDITRGKKINSDQSWLSSFLFKEKSYKKVGFFKGEWEVLEESILTDLQNLGLDQELKLFSIPTPLTWSANEIDRNIMTEVSSYLIRRKKLSFEYILLKLKYMKKLILDLTLMLILCSK